ncbi:MAG: NAD-dependent epimerase/dehydratase family protein [Abditibacteriota bacterium]|nr:NAD-dependent epimerase/dehydratase family protein [Abditibacteriota bacterium]
MNILVTGSKGFVGKNLIQTLKNIRDGKDNSYPALSVNDIYEYDIDISQSVLEEGCQKADFVFNLAGVNRPKDNSEFMEGNFGFASTLLDTLKKYNNKCPVMLSSSIQASLVGRYAESDYGKSKLAGEELFFQYGKETGAKVLIYRFQNLFGKWSKPNYNTVIATFCYNIAHDLPIQVNDPKAELELVYIDDLVNEMIAALLGMEHHCEFEDTKPIFNNLGKYCCVPTIHHTTLGEIVDLLHSFKAQSKTFVLPQIPPNSFAKKLYSTYLSFLPKEKAIYDCKMNCDNRGSFTELIRTLSNGQFSVNISKPGILKGQHWHNSKWEIFIVVSGHGLIRERNIQTGETVEFEVSGDKIQAIYILPGWTHNIINLSTTEDLVTFMWVNEQFDPNKLDTYREDV